MDMKVDSQKLIQLRNARAWSQQHLADVSGLSLRTIQRIEKTQSASHDSIGALASVFETTPDAPFPFFCSPANRAPCGRTGAWAGRCC